MKKEIMKIVFRIECLFVILLTREAHLQLPSGPGYSWQNQLPPVVIKRTLNKIQNTIHLSSCLPQEGINAGPALRSLQDEKYHYHPTRLQLRGQAGPKPVINHPASGGSKKERRMHVT